MSNNIFTNNYTIVDKLSEGTYGIVYKVEHIESKKNFACKKFVIDNNFTYCNYNELIAHNEFNHSNLIEIYDILVDYGHDKCTYYVIMELCDGCLFDILFCDKVFLDESQRLDYLIQIIDGLEYMWSKGFVHNDLSLTNILVKNNKIKIADFGFMYNRFIKQDIYHRNTIYIQPPELISGHPRICDPNKIDTWALGQIFYVMCYNSVLYNYSNKTDYYLDIISKTNTPSLDIIDKLYLSDKYKKLYYNIFRKNIKKLTQNAINELVCYNKSTNKFSNDNLRKKTSSNKFIKKHMNWSVRHRPDIKQSRKLFYEILANKYPIYNSPIIQSIIPSTISFREFSFHKLWSSMNNYDYLFKSNLLFGIHFEYKIRLHHRFDYQYNLIVKIMLLMGKIIRSCFSKYNKFKCLNKFIYPNNNYLLSSQISRLENSFDRFYSMGKIIYCHYPFFENYIFDYDTIKLSNSLEFQYHFIDILDKEIPCLDAYDIFLLSNCNKMYQKYFKYMYYLFVSSPNATVFDNNIVYQSIMLIIISYKNSLIYKKLINQFLKLNISTKIKYSREINHCFNDDIINVIEIDNDYGINLNYFTVDTIITAYYIIHICRLITNEKYNLLNINFAIESKFIKYLDKLVSVIDME
ncbi:putative serine/threonine-protein kinase [Acanthamoeba castellanii mimivirus]|uniref:Putative serine/threonine-protein kinase L232 n=6 Tax=Mimivirus TaxID=315393 RepID=YL232_MIMIV|nr:putative serine/threonine-protein kinase [Acanthamoeba polyphaga mimivirus]Q5UQC1.1 RecName: Full=Putative serine/threonine-protein kinase L232 [Acanthamoeba polyphaga mimivirus]ALR83794.1 putative serine/threonine-protein kinase [Niemeyer virus]AMK61818.1 serine threonine protein kinase [Samba virus]AMZ02678.1 putative serine/threonine-protein kinase [Mimivirus Bombay]BAV61322.1 putative serine/threonine-protein kinase [Acanthamoeba castellanii mimivirus]AAV50505.1 serine/threonine protei